MIMNRSKIRVSIDLAKSFFWSFCYIPHFLFFLFLPGKKKQLIRKDLGRWESKYPFRICTFFLLLMKLHTDPYFRTVFYHRIGPLGGMLIGWWRPGAETFIIPPSLQLGGGIYAPHAYATVLNAASIGENFTCIQCTTVGKEKDARPIIGDNVCVQANAVIVGGVRIGNDVLIAPGAFVNFDVPDNSIVIGNPGQIIRRESSPTKKYIVYPIIENGDNQ